MDPLVIAIRLQVDRMSALLGMSPEHVIRDCSIRELLLTIAAQPPGVATPGPSESPPADPSETDVAAFAAEVLNE